MFVGGLHATTSEGTLKRYLERFGRIIKVTFAYDYITKRPRGFGFVEFRYASDANEAINYREHWVDGTRIDLKVYRDPRKPHVTSASTTPAKLVDDSKVQESKADDFDEKDKDYSPAYSTVSIYYDSEE